MRDRHGWHPFGVVVAVFLVALAGFVLGYRTRASLEVARPVAQDLGTAPVAARAPTRPAAAVDVSPKDSGRIEVRFSPHAPGAPGCTDAVVELLDGARRSVRLTAYGFTSRPILDALARARRRGVDVALVLDRSNDGKAPALEMRGAGAAVWIDRAHRIQHEKVLVVDGEVAELGSFNFTAAAEKSNAETCAIVRDPAVARVYLDEWERHRAHAEAAE